MTANEDLERGRRWLGRAAGALSAGEDSHPDTVGYAHAAAMIGHGFVALAHAARSFDAMDASATLTARQIAAVAALTDEIHGEPTLVLDAYAARDGGQSGGATVGELAPLAIDALRDVLNLHIVVRGETCRACTFLWPCATVRMITTALEAP